MVWALGTTGAFSIGMKRWTITEEYEGTWRAVLTEDGIKAIVAWGSTPEEALRVGRSMDRKARKAGGR